MSLSIGRREILKFLGGAAVGTALSPLPWKLTDDLSIWTQNWSWMPRLPHGPITIEHTTCSLCTIGCGVRVRCVAGQPFQLGGVTGHPASGGTLCPLGLAAHQLRFHPRRLRTPMVREGGRQGGELRSCAAREVFAALRSAITASRRNDQVVAVLDARPGSSLSTSYDRFLAAIGNGVHLLAPGPVVNPGRALARMFATEWGPCVPDLENARTILSFGAPVLEGVIAPGRLALLRRHGSSLRPLRVLQVDAGPTRTALLADRWLRIRPGSEAALALGIGHVLLREQLCDERMLERRCRDFRKLDRRDYRTLVAGFTPSRVSGITGLPEPEILECAREFARGGPSLVLQGAHPGGIPYDPDRATACQALNMLLGAPGSSGGLLRATEAPFAGPTEADRVPRLELQELPDRSVGVLILDPDSPASAVPWPLVHRKLASERSLVVSLSPYLTGLALHADWVLPSPSYLEETRDIGIDPLASRPSFSITRAIARPPAGALAPRQVIRTLAHDLGAPSEPCPGDLEDLRDRVRSIHRAGRGEVFLPAQDVRVPVEEIPSEDVLFGHLMEGGCWIGDRSRPGETPAFLLMGQGRERFERLASVAGSSVEVRSAQDDRYHLRVTLLGEPSVAGGRPLPPALSKLYRESGLRSHAGSVLINPGTAAARGLADGSRARVLTPAGSLEAVVVLDAAALEGVLHLVVGPDPSQLGFEGEDAGRHAIDLLAAADGRMGIPARIEEV